MAGACAGQSFGGGAVNGVQSIQGSMTGRDVAKLASEWSTVLCTAPVPRHTQERSLSMFSTIESRLKRLKMRYREPHRSYHDQSHIDCMLFGLHSHSHAALAPEAVELAIWYHDAVYDPAATDNESRSADLLRAEMGGLADPGLVERAAAMVLASATHALPEGIGEADAADMSLFLDLDLQVLGAFPDVYDAYEAGIAAEYVPVHGIEPYAAGRAAFLDGMVARPGLFLTKVFHSRFDARARDNMRRAAMSLRRP